MVHPSESSRNSQRGLTLIEVMIVVGLVSVLTYAITTVMVSSTRQAQSVMAKTEFTDLINTMQSLFNNTANCTQALQGVSLKQNPADFPQSVRVQMGETLLQEGLRYGSFTISRLRFTGKTDAGAVNQYVVPLEIEIDRRQGASTAVGGNLLKNTFELVVTVQPPWSAGASPDAPIIGCAGKFNNQWTEVPGGIAYTGGNVGIGPSFGAGTPPEYPLDVSGTLRAGAVIYNSDRRLKDNVRDIPDSLERVLRLRGVLYDWKNQASTREGRDQLGLIAQEVEQVFPEAVSTDSRTGLKSVAYGNLISPLIEAVKEQQEMIRQQRRELDELRAALRKKTSSGHGR
jgi:prepilin-type N-terminal cleavage/methylation domain-containing protein